ncbi:MAG: polysaccharide deacetylase family protein [Rhodobacteraceae bacterium]|nr:polysaccharide deacetylase family protein [Paracoccaceae bacterium]
MLLSERIPYQAAPDRPRLTLPGGARIAVWVIVNVEHWSMTRAMPRTVLPPPMGQPLLPDVPNWSWHEYGMRSGFWRQHAALTSRDIPVTFAINGSVCTEYPRVAAAGWEFMGHGHIQGPMHKLDNQAAEIARAQDTIEAFCGTRPVSWESPGLTETDETLDLLAANGVKNVADWVIDDLPETIETPSGPVTTLPYTVENNDIAVHALQGHPAPEFLNRGRDQFDRLYAEGADNARIMAISVHPYITGVPHRIRYLEELLDYVKGHENVAWMTGAEIGDWYRGEMGRLR